MSDGDVGEKHENFVGERNFVNRSMTGNARIGGVVNEDVATLIGGSDRREE